MTSVLFGTIATAIALLSAPAHAGWENAAWGMTPEQVSAVVPGLRPVRFGMSLSGARKRSVRDTDLYGIAVEAEYFYDRVGLAFIRFDVPFDRCPDLVDGLLDQYAQPTHVSDQVILKVIVWEDAAAGNRVSLLHSSAGICDLRLRPLSEAEPAV